MKKLLSVLLLCLTIPCAAASFTDPLSGMTFAVPQDFKFNKEESGVDEVEGSWWYLFSDSHHNTLTVEIDEYDHVKSLPEYFHHALTEDEDKSEGVIFEGMEFKNIKIRGMEFTKCKLRILAVTNKIFEPLYFCDYLFVKDRFGISINLTKREDGVTTNKESDAMMLKLLHSIQFNIPRNLRSQ